MAKDILDDLENDFDDDMEDILEESSLNDPGTDTDAHDAEDLGDDSFDEESLEDTELSEKKEAKKNLLVRLKEKIPQRLKNKKNLVIIGAATLAVVLIAVALFFFVFSSSDDTALIEEEQIKSEQGAVLEQEIIFEDIVELEPFERIQLKTSSTMGFLNLTLSLELTDHRYRKQIYSMEDRIRQIVETQAAEMTWLELRNPDGKIRMKYDLLKRMNSLFPKPAIRNIYFTYFIMQ